MTGRPVTAGFTGARPDDARKMSEGILQALESYPEVNLSVVGTWAAPGEQPGSIRDLDWMSSPGFAGTTAVTFAFPGGSSFIALHNIHGPDSVDDIARKSHAIGYLASSQGVVGTGHHEFAHSLWLYLLGHKQIKPLDVLDIVLRHAGNDGYLSADYTQQGKEMAKYLTEKISGYAGELGHGGRAVDIAEVVAEAFAMVQSGRGSPVAEEIVDFLTQAYRRQTGA